MQQEHEETNYIMLAIVLAFGVFLVAGLVVVPAIDQADAANGISDSRNKGKQGFAKSGGQGGGCDACV